MDANRLIRFSVAGWAFALVWPLQAWILGADFTPITETFTRIQTLPQGIAVVLVGVAAGPILGFVVSTLAYIVTNRVHPEFKVPEAPEEFQRFESSLEALIPAREVRNSLQQIANSVKPGAKHGIRQRNKEIEAYFNLLFHTRAPSTLIDYTARRWTMYWMYANSLCALTIATLFALFTSGKFWERGLVLDPRSLIEIILVLFVVVALRRIKTVYKEIYDASWIWLYVEARY